MYVTATVLRHERLRHIDDDVDLDVPFPLKLALLGAELEISTLPGAVERHVLQAATLTVDWSCADPSCGNACLG